MKQFINLTKRKVNTFKTVLFLAGCVYSTSAYCSLVEKFGAEVDKIDAGMMGKVVGTGVLAAFAFGAYKIIDNISVQLGMAFMGLGFGIAFLADHLIQQFFGG
ncbi:MAG: hypothetical protein GW748_05245 [Alphaproteobacteria bacterium]|nr:hypothetical protein [Alphaproteobacteria bacterium]NCQ67132.1 hypothetical protein [Alphaproteobacteria bacterium]NCT07728.1 hypothetical protein [Alphaproteobacteria bacterium]